MQLLFVLIKKNYYKLINFYNKVGKIDILLDDGGHYNKQQIITLNSSIPNITDGGMIVVEDCHASYMSEFGNPSKFSFMNFSKYIIDKIKENL